MSSAHFRALLDGAGGITLFPDHSKPMGSFELYPWRMAGMTAMFALVVLSLAISLALVLRGVSEVWAVLPYVLTMALMMGLQWRRARVPAA